MRFIFLGTGGLGVPQIGIPAAASPPRTSNALVVQPDYPRPPTLLVDAGPDIRTQWANWSDAPPRPDAILLTHGHFDHIGGMPNLWAVRPPIPVYGSPDTLSRLDQFAALLWQGATYTPELHPLPDWTETTVCGVSLMTVPLHHSIPVSGFLFRCEGRFVAHFSDTGPIIDGRVRDAIRGCDVLIVDTPRVEASPGHIGVPEAIALAQDVGARRLILTHVNGDTTAAMASAIESERTWVVLAHDGLVCDV